MSHDDIDGIIDVYLFLLLRKMTSHLLTDTPPDRHTTGRQMDIQAGKQIDRQINRQTNGLG